MTKKKKRNRISKKFFFQKQNKSVGFFLRILKSKMAKKKNCDLLSHSAQPVLYFLDIL